MVNKKKVEDAPVSEKPKKEKLSLHAWFAYVDKEGFKVKSEYRSEGETVAELLAELTFPAGCNCLVNVTYKNGEREFSRALAPHSARKVLEGKDEFEFDRLFKGV